MLAEFRTSSPESKCSIICLLFIIIFISLITYDNLNTVKKLFLKVQKRKEQLANRIRDEMQIQENL